MAVSEDVEKILREKKNVGVGRQTQSLHDDYLEWAFPDYSHKA